MWRVFFILFAWFLTDFENSENKNTTCTFTVMHRQIFLINQTSNFNQIALMYISLYHGFLP